MTPWLLFKYVVAIVAGLGVGGACILAVLLVAALIISNILREEL